MSPEEYAARALGAICEAAGNAIAAGSGNLVGYRRLPAIVHPDLFDFFGIESASGAAEPTPRAASRNAKNPFLPFEPDAELKNTGVSEPIREAVRRWLDQPYARLESLRMEPGFA